MESYHRKLLVRYLILGVMCVSLVLLLLLTIVEMTQPERILVPEVVQLEAPSTGAQPHG